MPPASRISLRDSRVAVLRALEPDDRERLQQAFERLSPTSRYRRFLRPMEEMSDGEVEYLLSVDHRDHEAILALDPVQDRAVGVARFVRLEAGAHSAEAAVAVVDDWQGQGLGRALLERLSERAREEGIDHFTAVAQAENRRAIEALAALGPTTASYDGSIVELDIELAPSGLSGALAAALRAAAGSVLDPRPLYDRILHRAREVYLRRGGR
jgi:GNAT superfamily N-acetyltransferase